jgi:DNA-binding response OmpR family regulator
MTSAVRPTSAAVVLIVADDLIWSSRLRAAVERAGATLAEPRGKQLDESRADLVVVDLGGRTYDGVAAVAEARHGAHVVIAVGQHEDIDLRKRALAAGAQRVYSYNKMFTDGPAVIARWLGQSPEGDAE